jgi:hypothetical protein
MTRLLGAFLIGLLVNACTLTPAPTATAALPPPPTEAAILTITGSGELCGPWWYGCGAALAIEALAWELPGDWRPGALDTVFAVDLRVEGELPARVTGVRQQGRERIEPGDYKLVAIETMTPDTFPSGATFSARVGCSVEVNIPPGTRAVGVKVEWDNSSCTIAVSR